MLQTRQLLMDVEGKAFGRTACEEMVEDRPSNRAFKGKALGWILRHRIDGEDNRALSVDDKISRRIAI